MQYAKFGADAFYMFWDFPGFMVEDSVGLSLDRMLILVRFPCFVIFSSGGGGLVRPPGVSKRSVVELRGRKQQQIALAK